MRIKPFQAVYPNLELVASADSFFGTVKYDYREFEMSGFFKKTDGEALYVYRITGPKRSHIGLMASVDIKDYLEGYILKHEDTLPSKEQDMTNLLLNRKAMIKPILLSYPKSEAVESFLKKVLKRETLYNVHFDEADEDHQIWKIDDADEIKLVKEAFSRIKKVYIADGHHRCSTSALLHQTQDIKDLDLDFSTILGAFMCFEQLDIHDYNRTISILNEISPAKLMASISEYCKIKPMPKPFKPSRKHEMAMLINKEWFRLRWKNSVLKWYAHESIVLDTTIMTDLFLKNIFHIKDIRADKRIKYIEGTKGTTGLIDSCTKRPDSVGFALFPVSKEEFIALSDLGQKLPPKSTWFEPRMKNGFIAQEF